MNRGANERWERALDAFQEVGIVSTLVYTEEECYFRFASEVMKLRCTHTGFGEVTPTADTTTDAIFKATQEEVT